MSSVTLTLLSWSALAQDYVPGEIIVKLKGQPGSSESYAFLGKAHSEKAMQLKQSWGKINMYHFGLSKAQTVESAIFELKQDPNVLYAEPNYYIRKTSEVGVQQTFSAQEIQSQSNESLASSYLATSAAIGAQSVWTSHGGMPLNRPVVAVIDTGLDISHYVFRDTQAVWVNSDEIAGNGLDDDGNGYVDDVNGWNFVTNSGTMLDDDGHGTHVSGIILSLDQNIYSSSPLTRSKIQIMPLKFLNGSGVGTTSNAIRAIYYAVNNGASVLNNSWGGPSYSSALHEAIAYTYSKGALFIAAAGNAALNNDASPMYPANYLVPNVISIAATTDYDYLASFSNYGRTTVHLASPGVFILSTLPGGAFGTSSGTSMASPFVAGTAIQMKVEAPDMLGYQLREILLQQYATISQLNNKVVTSGRLNSAAAVNFTKTATLQTSQPAYSVSHGADRELASQVAGGGCGTVKALTENGQTPWGGAAAVVLLIFAPALILITLRLMASGTRRQHERFTLNSDVRINVGGRELVGSVSTISLGGACVNTSALLQDGGLITMSIASPTGEEKIEVAGRVVWSEANKAYGVAFDQAPQSALAQIADWTKDLKKAS